METKSNIHEGHRFRLAEKLMTNSKVFRDHELLEVLLFYVIPRKDTNELAHKLIRQFGSVTNLFNASHEQLVQVEGVGKKTATLILCVGELFARFKEEKPKKVYMYSFADVKEMLEDYYKNEKVEKFTLSLLDKNYSVIKNVEFSDQKKSFVGVDVQNIAKEFTIHCPAYAIFSHNHTSGDVSPSEEDNLATKKLRLICELYGVELLDHVIVGENKCFSYFREGLLDKIKQQADIAKILNNIKEI